MHSEGEIPDKSSLDALADRIKVGIAHKGVHLLFEEGLALIWRNNQELKSHQEKSLIIRNFAITYGLDAYVNAYANMAIFRVSNQPPAAAPPAV